MIVSAARPYFCPHPAYIARVVASDVFVVLDDVQFPRGSTWITRNRFKNDQGTLWMSIPVCRKGLGIQKISDVRAQPDARWRRKHILSLRLAYKNAPYRDDHVGVFERVLLAHEDRLVEMNLALLSHALAALGAETPIVRMSGLGVRGEGTALLVEICRELGASTYLAGVRSRSHVDAGLFAQAHVELAFMRDVTPVYPQLWGGFIPDLSVYDLLFNCGPRASAYVGVQAVRMVRPVTRHPPVH